MALTIVLLIYSLVYTVFTGLGTRRSEINWLFYFPFWFLIPKLLRKEDRWLSKLLFCSSLLTVSAIFYELS
jgi:hypothetical protein